MKAEFRGEVPGLVHDTSASGATVFIEPMSVVELNNEIRVLRSDEQEEISRILLELSGEAGSFADSIIESYHYAVELDLIFAKAQVAYKMKAVVPQVGEDRKIVLHSARHPLDRQREGGAYGHHPGGWDFDALDHHRPQHRRQDRGFKDHWPADLDGHVRLDDPGGGGQLAFLCSGNILADIGDEQSIEQSLSTFSSHMANIIQILQVGGQQHAWSFWTSWAPAPTRWRAPRLAMAIIGEAARQGGAKIACYHPLRGTESLCHADPGCGKRLLRV